MKPEDIIIDEEKGIAWHKGENVTDWPFWFVCGKCGKDYQR